MGTKDSKGLGLVEFSEVWEIAGGISRVGATCFQAGGGDFGVLGRFWLCPILMRTSQRPWRRVFTCLQHLPTHCGVCRGAHSPQVSLSVYKLGMTLVLCHRAGFGQWNLDESSLCLFEAVSLRAHCVLHHTHYCGDWQYPRHQPPITGDPGGQTTQEPHQPSVLWL